MPPFEGFDCTTGTTKAGQTAEAELNNNVLLLDNTPARKEVAAEDDDDEIVVDDKGQRLVDTPIPEAKEIEKEAHKRELRGRQFVWHNIILITVFHALALWATFTYVFDLSWKAWIFSISLGGLGGLGVTAGCHRLWSHRSYKASVPLRVFLALCYSIAGQNTILEWVRDHRVHHKFTETDADPHNVKRGFFFAHVGWLMQRKHPDVLRQGQKVDLSDVQADPVVQWHQRHFLLLKILLCFVLPPLVPVYMWNEPWHLAIYSCAVVRYVLLLNFTWLVNSAAHMFGNKPFDKRINPTENVLVSAVAMGEGWHNYHHVFPWDYKTSEYSYFFNATTIWIDIFSALGLAFDCKTATPDMVRRVALRHGDNSHPAHKRVENDHHHPEEVTYDEYLRVIKEDDVYTGVKDLHNEEDVTRLEKSRA